MGFEGSERERAIFNISIEISDAFDNFRLLIVWNCIKEGIRCYVHLSSINEIYKVIIKRNFSYIMNNYGI